MPGTTTSRAKRVRAAGPEFDLAKAWVDSNYSPAVVYQMWRALYKAYGAARKQFPDVDWISLIAILDVIAVARANRRRVDVSYLAEELGWPRTTALRRLQKYAGSGYLTLTREGRHTYVDNTRESRRAALKVIDVVIDHIERTFGPHPIDRQLETSAPVSHVDPPRRHLLGPVHPKRTPEPIS
jgi:hypothetical protein